MSLHNVKVGDELIVIRDMNVKRVVVTKINIRDVATSGGRFMKDNGKSHGSSAWSGEYAYAVDHDSIEREAALKLRVRATRLLKELRELDVILPARMTAEQVESFSRWMAGCPVRYGA